MSRRPVSASCHGVGEAEDGRRSRRRKVYRRRKGASPETGKRCLSRLPGLLPPVSRVLILFFSLSRGFARPAEAWRLHPVAIDMSPAKAGFEFRSLARARSFSIFSCPAGRENFPRGGREFRLSAREFPLRGENLANGVCEIFWGAGFQKNPNPSGRRSLRISEPVERAAYQ